MRLTTVAVTGAAASSAAHVVRDLHEHGYRVVALDRVPDPDSAADAAVRVDLTDYGQVIEALTAVDDRHHGVDAVVHLAAIPAPGLTTNAATFANNITATYNVFAAARIAGIRNVVWASSETVLGLPFDMPPPYIPVDEEYPVRPESTYSLVKSLEEEMARHFCRWEPELKMIGLRFSNVMDPEDYARFPAFDADPRAAAMEPVGLHRRPRRRPGRPPRPRARRHRRRHLRHRQRRHGHVARAARTSPPSSTPASRSPASSASTRPCCRSTRPAACSATSRSTAGGADDGGRRSHGLRFVGPQPGAERLGHQVGAGERDQAR